MAEVCLKILSFLWASELVGLGDMWMIHFVCISGLPTQATPQSRPVWLIRWCLNTATCFCLFLCQEFYTADERVEGDSNCLSRKLILFLVSDQKTDLEKETERQSQSEHIKPRFTKLLCLIELYCHNPLDAKLLNYSWAISLLYPLDVIYVSVLLMLLLLLLLLRGSHDGRWSAPWIEFEWTG